MRTALMLAVVLMLTVTAPSATTTRATSSKLRVVVLSDFNGPYGATTYPAPLERVVERIVREWKPQLVLSAGDVIAGQSAKLADSRFPKMWAGFDAAVRGPLAAVGIPFAQAVGNHDGSSSGGFERERSAARAYWAAHKPKLEWLDSGDFPFHYSFMAGGVFIAVVDASSAELQNRAWLAAALQTKAAQSAAQRIVIGHLPLYGISVGRSTPGNVLRDAERIRALLEGARVTMYISGHHAAYYPGRRGALRVFASGGIGSRDYIGYPGTARSTVSVLEFSADGISDTTFDAVSGAQILRSSLPLRLDGLNGSVTRDDLPSDASQPR